MLILSELDLLYQIIWIPYSHIKVEPYISLNPNGRLPAMIDPNTGVNLFESGAIIEYLVATYDKDHLLTYRDDQLQDKWLVQSWLMFQMSGQGPMFGQRMWFVHFHTDKNLVSAIERYGIETKRIIGVLDQSLRKQKEKLDLGAEDEVWLVGDKCTIADLSFVLWDVLLFTSLFPEGHQIDSEFPEFYKWHTNVIKRPAVSRVIEYREECMRTMEDSATAVLPDRK